MEAGIGWMDSAYRRFKVGGEMLSPSPGSELGFRPLCTATAVDCNLLVLSPNHDSGFGDSNQIPLLSRLGFDSNHFLRIL